MKKNILTILLVFIIGLFSSSLVYADSNDVKIIINNETINFNVKPIIIKDEIMVPVEEIANKLNLELDSYPTSPTKIIYRNYLNTKIPDLTILMISGKNIALVDNIQTKLDVPAKICNNNFFVPLKFICKTIGAEFNWDTKEKIISITYNQKENAETDIEILKQSLNTFYSSSPTKIKLAAKYSVTNLCDEKTNSEVTGNILGIYPQNTDDEFEKSITKLDINYDCKKAQSSIICNQYNDDLSLYLKDDNDENIFSFNLFSKNDLKTLEKLNNKLNISAGCSMLSEIKASEKIIDLFNADNTETEILSTGEIVYKLCLNKDKIENEYSNTYLSDLLHYNTIEFTITMLVDKYGNLKSLNSHNFNTNTPSDAVLNIKQISIDSEINFEYDIDSCEVYKSIVEFNKKHTSRLIPDPELEKAIRNQLQITMLDKYSNDNNNLTEEEIQEIEQIDMHPLTPSDLEKITSLKIHKDSYLHSGQKNIVDLEGIQYLINIEELEIANQYIEDISRLKDLKKLYTLTMSTNKINDLSALKTLQNLVFLDVSYNNIKNISSLKDLNNLQFLCISNNKIEDLTALNNIKDLIHLDTSNNNLQNIDSLSKLNALQSLNINNNKINDITCLSKLDTINDLFIAGNDIENLLPLKNLLHLKRLDVSNMNIHDISILRNMNDLQYLSLSDTNIDNIDALKNMLNLTNLNLNNTKIDNIDALKNLVNLEQLSLNNNGNIKNMEPINNLKKLEQLDINNTTIQDIYCLSDLTNMVYLDMNNNNIKNIAPLKNLTNLKQLSMDNNEITNITSLKNLTNLEMLSMNNNKIKDITTLKNLYNLMYLDITFNNISDFSVLETLINTYTLN